MDRELISSLTDGPRTTPAIASPDVAGGLLPPEAEARVFWQMRRRLLTTSIRQAISQSRFRVTLIVLLTSMLWGGLFWLFADAFFSLHRMITHTVTLDRLVQAMFCIFFAALMVMLVFSSGILLYGSLFRAADLGLLLALPARAGRIFLHKFEEAVFLSSWAFLLLGSPVLLAYGLSDEAPWYYYAMLLPLLVAFTYIPASLGAIGCMAIVRWWPTRRIHVLVLAGIAVVVVGVALAWWLLAGPSGSWMTPAWFEQVLIRLRFTEQRLLPSWWLSCGLLEAARGQWSQGVLFLALMVANALFFRQLALWTAKAIYREAYSGLAGKTRSHARARAGWLDRAIARAAPLPAKMRLLLVKDLRLFRRDPVQWSQFLIFFGLLALYFMNIRRLNYDVQPVGWANMISFLNLSVVGLILATFTTRFVFPMISLESRRFWILGLLPIRRETVVWSKFLFTIAASIIPCSLLILLSDAMLRVGPLVLGIHQLTCALLCAGLAGIAVGLGAMMPDLREQSPSRIAAGFGGTLNLVLSALYILAIVMLTALPCHFYLAAAAGPQPALRSLSESLQSWLRLWLFLGTFGSILLGITATVLPMRMGLRAFRRTEF